MAGERPHRNSPHWISGVDEAGYGPTLGPLVVGLVTIEAPEPSSPAEPWRRLSTVVARAGRKARRARKAKSRRRRLIVADSKQVHRPAKDLSRLEESVLAFIACERGGKAPATFRELIAHLTNRQISYLDAYPWYRDADFPLPLDAAPLALEGSIRKLRRRLDAGALRIGEVRALPVDVREFNDNLARLELNKSAVNAWAIGRFLKWLWHRKDRNESAVWIDRLGGRQRYGSLLYPLFRGARFRIISQEEDSQEYLVEDPAGERALRIHFNKESEEKSFPTALASMTAKYVRELHMHLFNRWWHEHSPEVRKTAGYPQDARRFLDDIEPLRKRLAIDDALLIRRR